jgi:hypothetical protein
VHCAPIDSDVVIGWKSETKRKKLPNWPRIDGWVAKQAKPNGKKAAAYKPMKLLVAQRWTGSACVCDACVFSPEGDTGEHVGLHIFA